MTTLTLDEMDVNYPIRSAMQRWYLRPSNDNKWRSPIATDLPVPGPTPERASASLSDFIREVR